MKKFLPLIVLLAAVMMVSCKSSTVVTPPTPGTSSHGVDASGNVWMTAPPLGEGVQIEAMPFDVPNNTEIQGNFYLRFPSDIDLDISRIEVAMNSGTHHMNMYRSSLFAPPDSIPSNARKIIYTDIHGKADTVSIPYQAQFRANLIWNQSDMLVEAQKPYLNWALPALPDRKQSVVHFAANDTLIIENHFVNIDSVSQTTPNGKGKFIVNLWKAPADVIPERASMLFSIKPVFQILPHSTTTLTKDCRFGTDDIPWPIYLLGMTGHFHSRGKQFIVDKMQGFYDAEGKATGDSIITNIYKSIAWDEPEFKVFATPIKLEKGQFLRLTGIYVNPTDNTFSFGPHVATEEHFNLFVWFSPSWRNGQTYYDKLN